MPILITLQLVERTETVVVALPTHAKNVPAQKWAYQMCGEAVGKFFPV